MTAVPIPKYIAPPDAHILGVAIKSFVQSILYEDNKTFFKAMMR